jgi:hypothetical protein
MRLRGRMRPNPMRARLPEQQPRLSFSKQNIL